jgi:hypothetical protein
MAKHITLTFATFAHSLGAHQRLTLEASQLWHEEYITADKATQTARREEFILNYLIGYLSKPKSDLAKVTKHAKKIMGQSRDDRTADDHKLYSAARMKFTYHIVRPEKSADGSGKVDPVAKALEWVAKMTPAQKRKFLAAM